MKQIKEKDERSLKQILDDIGQIKDDFFDSLTKCGIGKNNQQNKKDTAEKLKGRQ